MNQHDRKASVTSKSKLFLRLFLRFPSFQLGEFRLQDELTQVSLQRKFKEMTRLFILITHILLFDITEVRRSYGYIISGNN